MGRVLYSEWSEYWPSQGPDVPFSEFINGIKKYVVSNTLTEATWANTTLVTGDVEAQLRGIKASTVRDIQMSGSATTVRWLLANDLLDELNLLVHPIAVGKGQRLFENTPTHKLELVSSKAFKSGVLHLIYKPAEE
jgi:dihydrofolate reductase